ncbi:MAG: hypothetical protein HQ547_00885 [Candidatus Omnitrophica bacterium]|nr:hypothetical protein [Candidatus Omnitrophota bacterium]
MRYKIPKFILVILAIALLWQFRPLEIEWRDSQALRSACLRQLAYGESERGPDGEPLRRSTRYIRSKYVQGEYGEAVVDKPRRIADQQFADEMRPHIAQLGYRLLGVAGGGDYGVVFRVQDPDSRRILAFKVFAPFEKGRGRVGRAASQKGGPTRGEDQFKKETACFATLARGDRPSAIPELVGEGNVGISRAGGQEFFNYYIIPHFDGIDLNLLRRSPYAANGLYHIFENGMQTLEGPRLLADAMGQIVEANQYMLGAGIDHGNLPRNILLRVYSDGSTYKVEIMYVDFGDSGSIDPQGFAEGDQLLPETVQTGLCGLVNEPRDLPWEQFLTDSLILATYPQDVADMFRRLLDNAAKQSINESMQQLAAIQRRLGELAQTTAPHAAVGDLDGDHALAEASASI